MAPRGGLCSMKRLAVCLGGTLAITILLALSPISGPSCPCPGASKLQQRNSLHRLAVLVPFRDRFDELLEFVPHMTSFLYKQNLDFHIFVLNQVDLYRFNRASLINAGFTEVRAQYDYIAMHDVDLLPLNSELSYSYPKNGPFHVASPQLHPRYHYKTFVGGILLISKRHFELVDGMSNKYWGWGLEDDEFYVRLRDAGLSVTRPGNLTTGTEKTFKHNHVRARRRRDMNKCYNQQEVTRKRDRVTGLHSVKYKVESKHDMTIDSLVFTIINIKLECDHDLTPWCDCSESNSKKQQPLQAKPP